MVDKKIHRVTFALFVVTATALLLSPAAIAQAPPPGSYLQSCQSAQMTGADKALLTAQCKDGNGRLQTASLPNAWTCLYDIANNNAQLSCQRPHGSGNYQTGPYTDSCSGILPIKNPNGAPQLLATCQAFLGIQPSLLLAPDSCDQNTIEAIDVNGAHIKGPKARILNVNGNLRCVERYTLDPKQQGNADIIGKTVWTDSSSTTHTYWTIDQPQITGIFDNYFQMTYEHGDTVTLWAGGWSQYGGSGHITWADYTNRSQGDHYAGLAKLPGTSAGAPLAQNDYLTNPGAIQIGPVRDSSGSPGWSFNGLPMKVYIPPALKEANGVQSPNPSLTLGYVDDGYWNNDAGNGYPDNGYYDHEPGEGSPVQITFQVDHPLNAATAVLPYAIPPDPKPFDLIFNQEDQNGAVLNPRWYSQLKDKPFAEKDPKDPKAPKPLKTFPNFGDSTKSNDICGPAFSTPSEFTAGNVVGVAASSVSGVAAGAELGSFAGPIGTAVGGIIGGIFGGWLFGGSIAADTPTAVDTGKLQALCTSQPVDTDQFKASSSWGSEMLAISTGAFHTVGGQLICGAAPIRGHLNWQPVTYTGMLNFSDWSGVFPEDDDVNMSFVPGTAADNGKVTTSTAIGQTAENRSMRGPTSPTPKNPSETWPYGGLLAEFDLGEMSFESSWWQQFYQLARSAGPSDALTATSEQLNGTSGTSSRTPVHDVNKYLLGLAEEPNDGNLAFTLNAVVTGLMGIDGAHGGGISELHPVFSMAIKQAKDDTQITNDKSSEKWQFFIRNHGDEGSCSYQTHTLEPDPIGRSPRDYYIQLPWPSDNPESVSGQIAVPPSQTDGVVGVEYYPGLGTYLHFLSPPYSTQGDAPFFEIDGAVTLTYTYPKSAQHPRAAPRKQMVAQEPTVEDKNADSTKAPTGAESFDAEAFPWQKILAASKDPAVTAHLKKYFTQQRPKEIAKATSPDIVKHFDGKRVEPKKLLRDAKLENRTHSSINVKNQRRLDDLFRNAGFSRPTFQAIDSQHVFFIGQDGVLRATEGPFKSDDPGKANSTKIIDRDIVAFEATSRDQVFTLNHHGQLLVEAPPFDIASDGRCAEGFVWRAAFSGDRVCVPLRTRDEAAADNLAAKSHANLLFTVFAGMKDICAPGYVWREANATDHVCVTPTTRSETQYDNRRGPSRIAEGSLKKFVAWPVTKFQVTPGGDLTTLDGYGRIWSFNAQLRPSTKPAKVAEKVRAFQSIDATHALVLTTDDRLQSYPVPAGSAAPKVYNNVWDFHQARDGSLFVIDGDDNLWNEQAQKQVETNVRKIQALDANTLFILKEDGTLSLRKTATLQPSSSVNAAVASGIRDFQAVDAQTVFVQDEDGKLWLESGNFGPEKPTKALVATNVR